MARQAIILAAGMGTRLGRPFPKPLTELGGGHSIMHQQISKLREALPGIRITVVVGFKRDLIMEAFPDVLFAYNELYDQTNTCKSLLRGLQLSADGGALWLNGDVVFDIAILERIDSLMSQDQSFVCVNTAAVGEEEVKYTVDESGHIKELSKTVSHPLGEAIGINYVSQSDKGALLTALATVDDQDYFERGIEVAVAEDGLQVLPVDISDLYAVEVDFEEDLARAKELAGDE
ncbi:MAG: UDP-N-acetylglucosamine pyrophosphorylase [Micrococcales bacterium]|nr:UDP-N-acetylglucosamine pyrophosphorylase [Micrococcales bacterium]